MARLEFNELAYNNADELILENRKNLLLVKTVL